MLKDNETTSHMTHEIANALSCITILSCVFLKVPQILFIRSCKVAEGISIEAILMEVTGLSIMTLYNYTHGYNLLTYLEYPIILLQVYVLIYYVLKYRRNSISNHIIRFGIVAYFFSMTVFTLGILPKVFLQYCVPLCTPLSGFAKVSYIYSIMSTGNADAISLTTWIISVVTNAIRIYTVYVDSADSMLLMNFTISTLLSSGVLLTAFTYQQISRVKGRNIPESIDREEPVRRKKSN